MIAGNPDKFAFLIEKVSDWSSCGFTNGLMYLYINGRSYPEDVHTATVNMELNNLTEHNSPMVNPVVDNELFSMKSKELFNFFYTATFGKGDYRFQLPLQELGDAGYFVFVVASDDNVRIQLVKQKSADSFELLDETVISLSEYKTISAQLEKFKEQLK